MAIDFPNSPALDDLFTADQKQYKYDGQKWVMVNVGPTGATGPTGPQGVAGATGSAGLDAVYDAAQAVISMRVFR